MPRIRHTHRWALGMHMDGCHWHSSTYACRECGHTLKAYHERDPANDLYSMIWMEPATRRVERDERGRFIKPRYEEVICERCTALQQGAPPEHAIEVMR
jgi:hypothetical protein